MCNWMSAIVLRNGDVLFNPATDSHEDLVALHNLHDNWEGLFARVEFSPGDSCDLASPEKYQLKIDEARKLDWFTGELQERVVTHLRSVLVRMIVSGDAACLIGGTYVLAKGASIGFVKSVRIVAMLGTSKVGEMWGTSQVGVMRDTSKVGEMLGTSQVGEMRETSQVGVMWGTSKVGEMRDTSKAPRTPASSAGND